MEATYNLKAIILNRKPFREADTAVTLYSLEQGKIELVARGAKKIRSKMAGHLEPMCYSEVMVIRGRKLDYAGGAASINCFSQIKSDLVKITSAGKGIKVFNSLIKDKEKDEATFNLLLSFLNILDEKVLARESELFLNFFILKLLVNSGYKPELYNCVICNNKITPHDNLIDIEKGGLVCAKCKSAASLHRMPISENGIKLLRMIIDNTLYEMLKVKTGDSLKKEISIIISSFLKFHL